MGGRDKHSTMYLWIPVSVFSIWISPPKILPPKIFGFVFSEPPSHAREARGVPANHWFSVAAATENQSETDLVSRIVSIYNAARTYFSTNG